MRPGSFVLQVLGCLGHIQARQIYCGDIAIKNRREFISCDTRHAFGVILQALTNPELAGMLSCVSFPMRAQAAIYFDWLYLRRTRGERVLGICR